MPTIFVIPERAAPSGAAVIAADPGSIVEALSASRGDVVVVSTDPKGAAAARAARFVLDDERVGLLALEAPPTLAFVLAAVAGYVPDPALGLLPGILERAVSRTRTFAALSSVADLRVPVPGLALTLRSVLPGGSFVVDWNAQQVTSAREIQLPAHAWSVVAQSEQPVRAEAVGWSGESRALALDGLYWGAPRWLEVTVVQTSLPAIVEPLLSTAQAGATRCRSCGRAGGGGICVFCQLPCTELTTGSERSTAMDGVGL